MTGKLNHQAGKHSVTSSKFQTLVGLITRQIISFIVEFIMSTGWRKKRGHPISLQIF